MAGGQVASAPSGPGYDGRLGSLAAGLLEHAWPVLGSSLAERHHDRNRGCHADGECQVELREARYRRCHVEAIDAPHRDAVNGGLEEERAPEPFGLAALDTPYDEDARNRVGYDGRDP